MADGASTETNPTPTTSKRVKERRQYTEDCLQDEEIEGRRMFSVEEKLVSEKFDFYFVKEMKGNEFNLKYIQENGFEVPVVIKEKTGLGMRMPSSNFTVNDVRQCVGSRRLLDVMDVTTQKDIEMTMKDWCRYFENTNRDKLLNVISLEFSHTKLENYVESPALVRQVDWVDLVWPRHLKESQTESTNMIEEMKYPKVQKYCLMSVKGCYTDFHIDFGGTSVWYHIMRGQKVFWLIPPTERNLNLYEQWVLSGKQGDVFFGDTVDKCAKVHLHAGYTFFIPTGWIHAVYTPEDSLVFGGNFLHSFGIEKQIRIFSVEDVTHVPTKFRYPFYVEMMWYVLQRYVFCFLGKNYLTCNENGDPISASEAAAGKGNLVLLHRDPNYVPPPVLPPNNGKDLDTEGGICNGTQDSADSVSSNKPAFNQSSRPYTHLMKQEVSGLKVIKRWLKSLPNNKKSIPDLIRDFEGLLADIKVVIQEHSNDDSKLAVTGQPSLFWSIPPKKRAKQQRIGGSGGGTPGSSKSSKGSSKSGANSSARRRRTRCKKCEACLRADCGECHFCKDMKKFGGPGRMKQSCISRQCMAPVLPHTACCMLCGRDGWEKVNNPQENEISSLMECSQCWEIVHPACLHDRNPTLPLEGLASDDLPNSWECPKCCKDGKPETKNKGQRSGNSKPASAIQAPMSVDTGVSHSSPLHESQNQLTSETPKVIIEKKREPPHKNFNEPLQKKVKLEEVKEEVGSLERFPLSEDENSPKPFKLPPKRLIKKSTSDSSPEEEALLDSLEDRSVLQECSKQKNLPGHVRSCSRFTVDPKGAVKTEAGGCKEAPLKNGNNKLALKYSKQPNMEVKNRSSNTSRPVLGSPPSRKHGETARERLFRNLKGLKKNSELPRHNVLRIKTKNLNDSNSGPSIQMRESPNGNNGVKTNKTALKTGKMSEATVATSLNTSGDYAHSGDDENSDNNSTVASLAAEKVHRPDRRNPEKSTSKSTEQRQLMLRGKANLKKPKYVVRPAPILEDMIEEKKKPLTKVQNNVVENLALEKEVIMPVLQFLSRHDLNSCSLVCKSWNRWCLDSRLWTYIDLSRQKITSVVLMGIIRRQPVSLNLSWSNINKRQLSWLIARLPQLKDLILSGCAAVSVLALCTSGCPLLRSLDLCWVEGLIDTVIRDLLAAPNDSRPGFLEAKTRLRQLMEVRVAGADISDVSVRLLAHHLPLLSRMDLSHCHKVTDMGIAVLGAAKAARLTHLDVSSCSNISDTSLEALKRCSKLMLLDMRECSQVTEAACMKFVAHGRHVLSLKEGKLMERHSNQ